jgi:hypothetical protein
MINEDIDIYDLNKAWYKMEENLVQSVSLNPDIVESDNEETPFNPKEVSDKLDKLYRNVGKAAQSAEFAGNDVWLVTGVYPMREPGQESVFIYANDDVYRGANTYDLFKRVVSPETEYVDTTIASGTIEEILPKAQEISPGKSIQENEEEPTSKTIKLDGILADLLVRQIQETGETEWTSNGPYLPKEVEDYILSLVGDSEKPFNVQFVKYGSAHPQEGRLPPIYVKYNQTT